MPKMNFLLFERSFELLEYNLEGFVLKLGDIYKVANFE
jgi:hypothetical protein